MIRVAILVRHHAHDFLAFHLGTEAAANAAVRAGGDHAVLGLAHIDQRLLRQGRGRAGLYAGAAGDAFGIEEAVVLAGRHLRFEAPSLDGQRERALYLLASTHAARTGDAFGWVEGEVRVGDVLGRKQRIGATVLLFGIDMIGPVVAVAHLAQAHHARHVLQLAVTVGRAGEAIERMIGDVQFHHAAAYLGEPGGLRMHLHAGAYRRGAGGRIALAPLDFHQAKPARAECLEHVGGAELRDANADLCRCAQHRGTLRHPHAATVDVQLDHRGGRRFRRAVVDLDDGQHDALPPQRAALSAVPVKSS